MSLCEEPRRAQLNTVIPSLTKQLTMTLHKTYINGIVLNVSSALVDVVNQLLRVIAFFFGRLREELLESWQRHVGTTEEGSLKIDPCS